MMHDCVYHYVSVAGTPEPNGGNIGGGMTLIRWERRFIILSRFIGALPMWSDADLSGVKAEKPCFK
jgi:hypothetical protein